MSGLSCEMFGWGGQIACDSSVRNSDYKMYITETVTKHATTESASIINYALSFFSSSLAVTASS